MKNTAKARELTLWFEREVEKSLQINIDAHAKYAFEMTKIGYSETEICGLACEIDKKVADKYGI